MTQRKSNAWFSYPRNIMSFLGLEIPKSFAPPFPSTVQLRNGLQALRVCDSLYNTYWHIAYLNDLWLLMATCPSVISFKCRDRLQFCTPLFPPHVMRNDHIIPKKMSGWNNYVEIDYSFVLLCSRHMWWEIITLFLKNVRMKPLPARVIVVKLIHI